MRKLSQLILLSALAPLIPAALAQEQSPAEPRLIEVGARTFWGDVYGRPDLPFDPSLRFSKFNEYRDIRNGLFIRRADVLLENVLRPGNYLRIQTQSTLLRDQAYLVTFGRLDKYKFQFRWDETPHIFSNTAQTLYTQTSPGVFTLPASVRGALTANPASAPALLAGVPTLDLSLHRKTGAANVTINPTPGWQVEFRFSREAQNGTRAIGTYSPGYEMPEPIDYHTTLVQANAEYAKEKWGVQTGYSGSLFENKVGSLTWDNGFSNTGGGRIDLYPDNSAHGLNFAGVLDLNKSTRVMASIAPGWMRQNDAFLPFSFNGPTPGLDLPARSLNGSKQTLAMNYTLVNHPAKHVELTARYRSYDYNNNTPGLLFPGYVLLDGSRGDLLPGTGRRMPRASLPYEFNRKNVELMASWEFLPKNTLKAGYEFERYDRAHRDVGRSDENALVTKLDLNPNKITSFRLSYRRSDRNPDRYLDNTENFPLGVEQVRQQLREFRRFDEAARVRDRVEASLQFNPLPPLTFDASFGTTQDRFNKSLYGLLKDLSHYYTFDVDYSPRPQFSLFGEYAREKYRTRQRARLFCGAGDGLCAGAGNNSPNNDWESLNRDLVDTWTGGIDVFLAKRQVTVSTFYSLSAAQGNIFTTALGDSRLPGFLLNSALPDCRFGGCTPVDFPETTNRLHNFVASVKFAASKTISPRFEYRYERYDRVDWQTQAMRPYMYGVDPDSRTQLFLGADAPSYRVHVLSASLEFRF